MKHWIESWMRGITVSIMAAILEAGDNVARTYDPQIENKQPLPPRFYVQRATMLWDEVASRVR